MTNCILKKSSKKSNRAKNCLVLSDEQLEIEKAKWIQTHFNPDKCKNYDLE